MGVCKVISERSVLYVFTFSRRTFDHPFGSSDPVVSSVVSAVAAATDDAED